jgi:transketolase
MVAVGIGIATRNKIPFISTFGAFFSRAADFIRIAGLSQSNIKLVGSHCGVCIGEDGPSQMALEDLAFMRTIPNLALFYPSDGVSAYKAVELAANYKGPVFIRTSRPDTALIYPDNEVFEIGKCIYCFIQLKLLKNQHKISF